MLSNASMLPLGACGWAWPARIVALVYDAGGLRSQAAALVSVVCCGLRLGIAGLIWGAMCWCGVFLCLWVMAGRRSLFVAAPNSVQT